MGAHFPVAVVGAGPAGSSCANAFLQNGGTGLALVDRAVFPRDKSCGDGLSAGVISVLDRLGLTNVLKGHPRIKRMEINFHDRIHIEVDTDRFERSSPLGHVIKRKEFDHALTLAALERGAADLTGWGLTDARQDGERWQLALEHSGTGETRTITCDALVGADGARSRVRRVLGQPFNTDDHTGIALRAYIEMPNADKGYTRLDILKGMPHPGYAWLFSDGTGWGNIGLGFSVRAWKRDRPKLSDMLGVYRQVLGDTVSGEPEDLATAILPTGFHRMRLGYPACRAGLVGDAASMINPVAGEGIFFGMYAGLILGEALAARSGGTLQSAFVHYDASIRAAFGKDFREARVLRKLLSKKRILEYVMSDFRASPDLCYDYIEFMMGVMPPRKGRSLAGLLFSSVSQRIADSWAR